MNGGQIGFIAVLRSDYDRPKRFDRNKEGNYASEITALLSCFSRDPISP